MLLLLFSLSTAIAGTSALWGEAGELWLPGSRLPDFSFAGYHAGEAELPSPEVLLNVADFGANGQDEEDDTSAFKDAIDAFPQQAGALLIPAGTYLLSDRLLIEQTGLVLRGEGSDEQGTTLRFTTNLTELMGAQAKWAWHGGFIWIAGSHDATPLTSLTTATTRADDTLAVQDPSALEPGMWVTLRLWDDDGSLARHLHNDLAEGGNCSWQQNLTHDWPVKIASIDGDQVQLTQPLRTDVRLQWSPELRSVPILEEIGVEHLRIQFPETDYPGHLNDLGYNAIFIEGGVADSWVKDVVIENADNGILTYRLTKNLTFSHVVLQGRGGHHGFNIAFSTDHLITDFRIDASYMHALTIDHRSNGCVFSRGGGTDLIELDHHRDAAFENLFTEIHGEINFWHGGSSCAGPPSGARETFWNLQGPLIAPYWGYLQANLVGQWEAEDTQSEDGLWIENIDALQPVNLYEAQRAVRLGLQQDTDDADSGNNQDTAAPSASACGCMTPTGQLAPYGLMVYLLGLTRRTRGRIAR